MTTYNGASFQIETEEGFAPRPLANRLINERPLPGGDEVDVQYGGKGRRRVVFKVYITSTANWNLLEAGWDGTERTLADADGVTYSNALIKEIRNVKKRTYSEEYTAEVEFLIR
jgi:hypothetical protein